MTPVPVRAAITAALEASLVDGRVDASGKFAGGWLVREASSERGAIDRALAISVRERLAVLHQDAFLGGWLR